ncbi:hypothetical protein TNIN_64101 [Trichonephila inaurata madagascariensis]|uniref:Uncharacterized protein n=1 Tax=Trichonephila inaurata madagascariensis TaxID=2747483 RepID=A0A8X7CG01_9ARAC|nr:hypothetical protein TNIN_64101 [Trichonephila inaurata madagascariensis]
MFSIPREERRREKKSIPGSKYAKSRRMVVRGGAVWCKVMQQLGPNWTREEMFGCTSGDCRGCFCFGMHGSWDSRRGDRAS